jgi:uncharacterized membrane protein
MALPSGKLAKKLSETLAEIEREGGLSPEQRVAVESRLAEALGERPDRAGRFVSIVAALGAVLVGAGILYLVGYNWDRLAKIERLAIVFGVWLSVYYAGYRLTESPGRYPRLGRAVTVLGVLCFGAAIGLVAQIYNLSSEYPNWVLAWWALSVPFVLLTGSSALLLVVVVLYLVWIFWNTAVWIDHVDGRHDQDFLAAAALAGAGSSLLFSSLAALSSRFRRDSFAGVLSGLARPAAIGAAYALSFRDPWRGYSGSSSGGLRLFENLHGGLHAQVFVPFALLALSPLLQLAARGEESREERSDTYALLGAAAVLWLTLAAWPRGVHWVANALLLAGILGLVFTGIRRGRPGDINWGIAAFVLCVLTRYVEYLWDKLEGAYAFIGIGLLLLLMGWALERKRRHWIARSAGGAA